MLHQGIEPQGYALMPYQAVSGDGLFEIGYKKGKVGHILLKLRD
jgi:hypothetical protein